MRNCWHPRFAGPTFLNFLPPTLLIDDCLKSLADFIKNRIQEAPNWIMLPLLHLNRFGDKVYGSAMKRFQKELMDVDNIPEFRIETGDFLTFADYFFDGIVADWLVQSKINDAKRQVDNAIVKVNYIMGQLKSLFI